MGKPHNQQNPTKKKSNPDFLSLPVGRQGRKSYREDGVHCGFMNIQSPNA